MIEMENMRLEEIRPEYQISQKAAVLVRFYAKGGVQAFTGGDAVRNGTYAADALGDLVCVDGITPLKYLFESAEHIALAPGVHDLPVLDINLYRKMPFNSRDGIKINLSH